MRKLFIPYANNKGADQPAQAHSLISTFVVHCLVSIIPLSSISKIASLSCKSDQCPSCTPHKETLCPWLPIELTVKADQTVWMHKLIWVFTGEASSFCKFYCFRLILVLAMS